MGKQDLTEESARSLIQDALGSPEVSPRVRENVRAVIAAAESGRRLQGAVAIIAAVLAGATIALVAIPGMPLSVSKSPQTIPAPAASATGSQPISNPRSSVIAFVRNKPDLPRVDRIEAKLMRLSDLKAGGDPQARELSNPGDGQFGGTDRLVWVVAIAGEYRPSKLAGSTCGTFVVETLPNGGYGVSASWGGSSAWPPGFDDLPDLSQ